MSIDSSDFLGPLKFELLGGVWNSEESRRQRIAQDGERIAAIRKYLQAHPRELSNETIIELQEQAKKEQTSSSSISELADDIPCATFFIGFALQFIPVVGPVFVYIWYGVDGGLGVAGLLAGTKKNSAHNSVWKAVELSSFFLLGITAIGPIAAAVVFAVATWVFFAKEVHRLCRIIEKTDPLSLAEQRIRVLQANPQLDPVIKDRLKIQIDALLHYVTKSNTDPKKDEIAKLLIQKQEEKIWPSVRTCLVWAGAGLIMTAIVAATVVTAVTLPPLIPTIILGIGLVMGVIRIGQVIRRKIERKHTELAKESVCKNDTAKNDSLLVDALKRRHSDKPSNLTINEAKASLSEKHQEALIEEQARREATVGDVLYSFFAKKLSGPVPTEDHLQTDQYYTGLSA